MSSIASMTGYAIASQRTPLGTLTIECRSVNSRFLDLNLRMPEEVRFCEPQIRALIQQKVARGKMEVRFGLQKAQNQNEVTIQEDALNRLLGLQKQILAALPEARPLSVEEILATPGITQVARVEPRQLQVIILATLESALRQFTASRQREGHALQKVLEKNCDEILAIVNDIEGKIPAIVQSIEKKLQERLESALKDKLSDASTLTKEEVTDRIRQEVTLYALRLDVAEEINRTRTHIAEVRSIMKKGGTIGRRLDFMTQELNREANTLGSKAAAIEMTQASIGLKIQIDQMREQIQNLE